jgi:AcrR family transcriptional regulator
MYILLMNARDRLIESAQELLWERGYVGTSPRAIQERAGAGQGSMYHHFSGKPDLALAAVRRSAEALCALAEAELAGPGGAVQRISAYLRRERDVLRGCRIGRLTQDPDIVADPALRQPLRETFDRLRRRLAEVIAEGQARGEIAADLAAADLAATILAALQGGYVLARAAGTAEPFDRAVDGALALLRRAAPSSS